MTLPGKASSQSKEIIIVSGLPRSGTSMMMAILKAGGVEVMTDAIRTADEDNLNGYFELEVVKKLREGNTDWLTDAPGKVVKVISALLEYLPPQYQYKIIFMQRQIEEILASQRQMLIRRGESPDKISDEKLGKLYQKHLEKITAWLGNQKNIQAMFVHYNQVLADPQGNIPSIASFLARDLNQQQMMDQVNASLYHQRQKPS